MFWAHLYHASSESHTKGKLLGIRKRVPWVLSKVHLDANGRFVILGRSLNQIVNILVVIYVPNDEQVAF